MAGIAESTTKTVAERAVETVVERVAGTAAETAVVHDFAQSLRGRGKRHQNTH